MSSPKRFLTGIAALAVVLSACATGATTETTATPTTTVSSSAPTTTPGTTNAPTTTSTTADTGSGISVAGSSLGQILVNPDGLTLYVFTNDKGTESVCYDTCAGNWPAIPADTPIGGGLDASMFGSTPRSDGPDQLTINGQPLYRFAADTQPGDTNGQGINGVWFVVGPDGSLISPTAGDAPTETDVDY